MCVCVLGGGLLNVKGWEEMDAEESGSTVCVCNKVKNALKNWSFHCVYVNYI